MIPPGDGPAKTGYPCRMTGSGHTKPSPSRTDADIEALANRVRSGERSALARAITLIESRKADHRAQAQALLQALSGSSDTVRRVGITGVPGVGKSTTIDNLGSNLTAAGHKVAVLAVDPSSSRTGGSILGDKTRMTRLAADPHAYIRPSPASGTLGGVAAKTRETMLLCEAAGFDVILVETVGIGQSETTVADMVDFFLVLMLPGAGDELQGIKKGVVEIADMIAVNKADGDNAARAGRAAAEYRAALHILTPQSRNWQPPVITVSGLTNTGLDDLWDRIEDHRRIMLASGELNERRREQQVRWLWAMMDDHIRAALSATPEIRERVARLEDRVRAGEVTVALAVGELVGLLGLE